MIEIERGSIGMAPAPRFRGAHCPCLAAPRRLSRV